MFTGSQPDPCSHLNVGSDFPSLTPEELATAGQTLFGPTWRGELARLFGVSEGEVTRAELGMQIPPHEWRAKLIGVAQDAALRALEIASNLLWVEGRAFSEAVPVQPPLPRFV